MLTIIEKYTELITDKRTLYITFRELKGKKNQKRK